MDNNHKERWQCSHGGGGGGEDFILLICPFMGGGWLGEWVAFVIFITLPSLSTLQYELAGQIYRFIA